MISIIVPVYKVEPYLRRCIDSILAQSFTDFELILVDDGSPDRCGEICDEYARKDSRVTVIHQENGGVSAARNAGLDIAKGQFLTFCDSDDYLLPGYLSDLMTAHEESGADLILSGYEREEGETVTMRVVCPEVLAPVNTYEEKILYLESISRWECWSSLFDLSLIRKNDLRFCTSCGNFAEDMCFTFEYILFCRSVFDSGKCNYRYVARSDSMMSQSKRVAKLNQMNEVTFQFGKRFLAVYSEQEKDFAFLFYKILRAHYQKIGLRYITKKEMRLYRSQVVRLSWYDRWLKTVCRYFGRLKIKLGWKTAMAETVDLHFCLGRWNLLHGLLRLYSTKHKRENQ